MSRAHTGRLILEPGARTLRALTRLGCFNSTAGSKNFNPLTLSLTLNVLLISISRPTFPVSEVEESGHRYEHFFFTCY